MLRWLIVPIALLALLLVIWLTGDTESRGVRGRTPESDRAAVAPTEQPLDATRVEAADSAEREPVAVLTGRVFGPNGEPVNKAQVWDLTTDGPRLATTGPNGGYELPLLERGPHLIEAEHHIDLAPQRRRIVVPDAGDSGHLDFHLEAAGFVYGEIVAADQPVVRADVDIYRGEKWLFDTYAENGFFNFSEEPPRHVPLTLRVGSSGGQLTTPVEFTYQGIPLNLGRIELMPWSEANVAIFTPEGREIEHHYIRAYVADTVGPQLFSKSGEVRNGLEEASAFEVEKGVIRIQGHAKSECDVVFAAPDFDGRDLWLRRRVKFGQHPAPRVEYRFTQGPIVVGSRLLDEHGGPLIARLRLREGEPVETDASGAFTIQVAWSGLHSLQVTALLLKEAGHWLELTADYRWPLPGVLLDADRPQRPCVLALDRCVAVRMNAGRHVQLSRMGDTRSVVPLGYGARQFWLDTIQQDEGSYCYLTAPCQPGEWRWHLSPRVATANRWAMPYQPERDRSKWTRIRFARRGLTILDAR